MTSQRLARLACALTIAIALVDAALFTLARVGTSYEPSESALSSISDLVIVMPYALVGVVVTLKRSANLVGWALLLAGLGMLLGGLFGIYGELALLARPEAGLPAGTAVAALAPGSWTPLMAGVFLLLVTFPSGVVGSRRSRRWAGAVLAGFALIWALITVSPGHLETPLEAYENPLGFLPEPALAMLVAAIAFCLVSVFVAGADVVRRFRRSRGQERLQFKWLTFSAAFLAATLPFSALLSWSNVAGVVFSAALVALPISVGMAVLRYRLYEIDRIVSRTIVYGSLTVVLGAAYVGLVLAGQALFSSFAGGSHLAIAVSTLVVAALSLPVRARIQRAVDRRFNRRRYDAQRTLETFGSRLREELDLETLTSELRAAVGETMQPARLGLWLRRGTTP